jgi:uncharacterized protein YgiM (DUF1202 family)
MIPLEERMREPIVGVHYAKMTQASLLSHYFGNIHFISLALMSRQLVNDVRKTGPWSNKIKQMWKQNTEDTQYNRDTDLRGSPSVGYVHQRNCQVLPLLLSSI